MTALDTLCREILLCFPVLLKAKGRISEDEVEVVFPGNGRWWCFCAKQIENEGEKGRKQLKYQISAYLGLLKDGRSQFEYWQSFLARFMLPDHLFNLTYPMDF